MHKKRRHPVVAHIITAGSTVLFAGIAHLNRLAGNGAILRTLHRKVHLKALCRKVRPLKSVNRKQKQLS
jgi:hypothetical protein